ncbi:uncharacterized protein LOC120192017 [Hibiscus syriacus]|uniref:uncharacterized protein LOC120192017 n=1 Tax=Hibiscus syriacus TaxID=106335 RepID=UPI001923185A|nr:uncharacterized protein LOC120192017 [Hibiscus syriacus]
MDTAPHADNPTEVVSPHIDIHQDLFPDYYGGTASSLSAPKDKFLGNDINNGSNKDEFPGNGIQHGSSNGPVIEENNFPAPPAPVLLDSFPAPPAPVPLDSFPAPALVPPGSSGEGLPYAPRDWPNAGDIWSWRVGKRVSASGFFNDRFINVPESLRKPNVPNTLQASI